MQNQEDDFTLSNYERCLVESKELGYKFFSLSNWVDACEENKKIILRHDVDTQIDIAVKIANIEYRHEIKSTYFIRLHSHNYNPLCTKDLIKIKNILSLGHEIGLHYESDFYKMFNKNLSIKECIDFEIDILQNVTNSKIATICPHEPTRTKQFHIDNLEYIQAYDPRIFQKFKYISDSSCRWRDGSFYENIKEENLSLYILTHPYWWYNLSPIENY